MTDAALDSAAATRLAVTLLDADRLSLSRAAELAGTDVRDLMDAMGFEMVPVVVEQERAEPVAA